MKLVPNRCQPTYVYASRQSTANWSQKIISVMSVCLIKSNCYSLIYSSLVLYLDGLWWRVCCPFILNPSLELPILRLFLIYILGFNTLICFGKIDLSFLKCNLKIDWDCDSFFCDSTRNPPWHPRIHQLRIVLEPSVLILPEQEYHWRADENLETKNLRTNVFDNSKLMDS